MPMNAEYCHGCGNQGEDPEQCERCMDGDLNV
jgi:primosomal protein N'